MPEALATGIDSGFVELLLKGVEVVNLKTTPFGLLAKRQALIIFRKSLDHKNPGLTIWT